MNRIRSTAGQFGKLFCVGLIAAVGAQTVYAEEVHIKMLDTSSAGPLAFEPGFVTAKVGDTIVFEPVQKGGHSTFSLLVPPGAQRWSGAPDKETRVKLDTEGVYLYACAAHKMMGMVGVIQVGRPLNLAAVKKVAAQESSKFALNKDRFDKELAQIK